jgi:hypothetical protein
MSEEQTNVKFGAQIDGALQGIDSLREHLEGISGSIGTVVGSFKELGEAALAAFAVEKAGEFFEQFADKATQIERLSLEFGILSDNVQGLQFALKAGGGSEDALQGIFTRMEVSIQKAIEASGEQRKAFNDLGVSTSFLRDNSDNLYAILLKESDGILKLGVSSRTVKDAVATMGRGMSELFPTIAQGSAHMEEFNRRLHETGAEMSEGQIAEFHHLHEELLILGASFQGVKLVIADSLLPAFEDLVAAGTVLLQFTTWMINKFKELQTVLGADLVIAAGYFIRAIQDLGAEVGFVVEKIIIRWKEMGAIITAVATGSFSLMKDIVKEADDQIAESAKKAAKSIHDQDVAFQHLKISAENAAFAINKAKEAENKKGGGGSGGSPSKSQLDDISTAEAIAKANLATQIAILQQEAAYHHMTKQQEVEQEKQAVDAEYRIVMQALQQKAALYAKEPEERHKVLNQMEVLTAQHTAKIAQLDVKVAQANHQAAQDTYNQWKSALSPIEGAFDGMLNGVLNGTQTLTQAMGGMFANMAVSVIESIAKIVLEWLLFLAVTEGQGSWSDFVDIQTGGKGGGPLGAIGSIFGFAEGTPRVERTGLALIHQDEMIIPAQPAQAIRDGAGFGMGGGATNVGITIQAIDTQSGAQFLRDNAGVIAGVLSNQIRNMNMQFSNAMRKS